MDSLLSLSGVVSPFSSESAGATGGAGVRGTIGASGVIDDGIASEGVCVRVKAASGEPGAAVTVGPSGTG